MQLQSHVIIVLYGLPDIFQNSYTILNYHQQYMGDPVSLHSCHFLVLSQFSFSHSDHVRIAHWHYNLHCPSGWWLIVLNIFFCLLVICVFSLVKYLFKCFVHFLNQLVLLSSFESCLYIMDRSPLSDVCFFKKIKTSSWLKWQISSHN